jgi:hypothetical protein
MPEDAELAVVEARPAAAVGQVQTLEDRGRLVEGHRT